MEIGTAGLILSAIGTVTSMASASSAAKFRQAAAERERVANEENARRARLQAAQQEVDRLEAFRVNNASRRAQAAALGFDPTISRSFFAIMKNARDQHLEDLDRIRLAGLEGERRFLLSADAAGIEASRGGGLEVAAAFLKGAGSVLKDAKKEGFTFGNDEPDIMRT